MLAPIWRRFLGHDVTVPRMFARWLAPDSPRRRYGIALCIYVVTVVVYFVVAGPPRIATHTPYNHYAHLAHAWLHKTHALAHGPPSYAGNNDFASFDGKTFISFPPFPAVLMLPFVAMAGSPERFADGQFVIWLAAIGPAVLFLILERLRITQRSERNELANVALTALFAFGSVYFFSAVQGTVWFAAHAVGVGALAIALLFSLDARRPFLAGLAFACAWTSRPVMLLATLVFALEALRRHSSEAEERDGFLANAMGQLRSLKWAPFVRSIVTFSLPLLASFALCSAYNYVRFHAMSPFAFGHEHLTVYWQARMLKWGLFSYHYLPKNLGITLTALPWLGPKEGAAAFGALFKINEHGLALWFTTPLYLWLLYPKRKSPLYVALALVAALQAVMLLMYQNSGWRQFGYRFSSDYALLLFVMLAVGGQRFGSWFRGAAIWSLAWNLFGAISFDREAFDRFYFREGSQTVLYQPD